MDGAVVVQPRRVAHGLVPAGVAVVDLLLRGGARGAVDHRYGSSDSRVAGSVTKKLLTSDLSLLLRHTLRGAVSREARVESHGAVCRNPRPTPIATNQFVA